MYKVIKMFDDLQDYVATKAGIFYHRYEVGERYPRSGYTPSQQRIQELLGSENAQHTPLIVPEFEAAAPEIPAPEVDEQVAQDPAPVPEKPRKTRKKTSGKAAG